MMFFTRDDALDFLANLPPKSRKRAGIEALVAHMTAEELKFDREISEALKCSEDDEFQATLGMVQ